MRLIEIATMFSICAVASSHDPATSASSLSEYGTPFEVPVVHASDVVSTKATQRQDRDFRRDAPAAGLQCTPSPLWAKEVDPADYEIGCEEVQAMFRGNITFAGKGGIRDVYIASYDGRQVALKKLKRHTPFAEHAHLLEIIASDAVKGRSNIVDILGFCGTTVVTEAYFETVQHIVQRATEPLPIREVVSMSLDAAIGLEALHNASDASIVHFDVNIDQLLVDDDGRVSISDLNFAYFMGTNADGSPCPFNTKSLMKNPRVKSPELFSHKPLTEKQDIYRMGLVFAQVLSAGGDIRFVAAKGDNPSFDPTWHQGYVKVIQDMLGEVDRRPCASELITRLQRIQQGFAFAP